MIERIKCPKCGELYVKTKPQHVICIDCYIAKVRENLAQRLEPLQNLCKDSKTSI
jgi:hypothetical protein